jgi:hypothetical protein
MLDLAISYDLAVDAKSSALCEYVQVEKTLSKVVSAITNSTRHLTFTQSCDCTAGSAGEECFHNDASIQVAIVSSESSLYIIYLR